MTYVDPPVWGFGRMMMCHMIADDLNELHAMADRIGVQRRWFQSHASHPHYDICKSKRELAVRFGAIELNRAQFAGKIKELRGVKL